MDFYLLGDMGSGTKDQKKVAENLSTHIKSLKGKKPFVCGLGDNIYENGCSDVDDPQFQSKFEQPYSIIPDDIIFHMALGNHDYGYSNRNLSRRKNAQSQIDYTKKSKKWSMPSSYYTFVEKKGPVSVEFFYLDTNTDVLSDEEIFKQTDFMKDKLKKSKCDWKILIGHHTWESVAYHGHAEDLLDNMLTELFLHEPFDIYVCGHDHNKQSIEKTIDGKIVHLIVCGTGGKEYDDGANDYNRLSDDAEIFFCSNNLGYGHCNAKKNKLSITFFDGNGQKEISYDLSK